MVLSLLHTEDTWVIKSTNHTKVDFKFKDHASALAKFRTLIRQLRPRIHVCEVQGMVTPYWIVTVRYSPSVCVQRFDDVDKRDEFIKSV